MMQPVGSALMMITLCGVLCCAQEPETEKTWLVPDCTKVRANARYISTGTLDYLVPKGLVVKKIRDVDYQEVRIFLHPAGKEEVLQLFWGVNASVVPSRDQIKDSARYVHRALRLSNGDEGTDARGTVIKEGTERRWRKAGVNTEFASYRDVSNEAAEYLDAIIDSVCHQSHRYPSH